MDVASCRFRASVSTPGTIDSPATVGGRASVRPPVPGASVTEPLRSATTRTPASTAATITPVTIQTPTGTRRFGAAGGAPGAPP